MKIIITAGGTSEKIDDVRTITNTSTGRLGYAIGTVSYTHLDVYKRQTTTSVRC